MDTNSLHDHYHQPDLTRQILNALTEAGVDLAHLSPDDLSQLDEFHIRGREATVETAALAELRSGATVLDLGCGIGGPARFLATEYGCRVTGLDLVAAYCDAASELTRLVGLADRVSFRAGDMRDMPFADDSFDCVWSQHTTMNIPDKAALAREIERVLKPGGAAVLYEVCAGDGEALAMPVPWASEDHHSHLLSASEFRAVMKASGLREKLWQDVSEAAVAWVDALASAVGARPQAAKRLPGLKFLMGEDATLKSKNMGHNLKTGRIAVVRGIFSA